MLDNFVTLSEIIPSLDDKTRTVFKAHRNFLRNHPDTKSHSIDPKLSIPEMYNWYRYLKESGYDEGMIYPILIVNDITDIMSLDTNWKSILIPSRGAVEVVRTSMY